MRVVLCERRRRRMRRRSLVELCEEDDDDEEEILGCDAMLCLCCAYDGDGMLWGGREGGRGGRGESVYAARGRRA
eukprot:2801130-Rhodomonas_salina.1